MKRWVALKLHDWRLAHIFSCITVLCPVESVKPPIWWCTIGGRSKTHKLQLVSKIHTASLNKGINWKAVVPEVAKCVIQNLNSVQTPRTRNANARAAISSRLSKTRFAVTVISSNAPAPLRTLIKLLLNSWSTSKLVVYKFCTHLKFSLKFCLT